MNPYEIKKLRLNLKMNQKQFADLLDVTQATVSYWETGKCVPNRWIMEHLYNLKAHILFINQ